MLGFGKKKEMLGGHQFVVIRDAVEGNTYYKRPKHPDPWATAGFYPYIGRHDHGAIWLCADMFTGQVRGKLTAPIEFKINADGVLHSFGPVCSKWAIYTDGTVYNHATFSFKESHHEVLEVLARSKVAVVRLSTSLCNCDLPIKGWHRQIVKDVLAGYKSLVPEKTLPAPSTPPVSPRLKAPPEPARPATGLVLEFGTLRLHPDGAISDAGQNLRLPPGLQIGGMTIGDHALESLPTGAYLVTKGDGTRHEIHFRDGRWFMRDRGAS